MSDRPLSCLDFMVSLSQPSAQKCGYQGYAQKINLIIKSHESLCNSGVALRYPYKLLYENEDLLFPGGSAGVSGPADGLLRFWPATKQGYLSASFAY